MSSPVGCGLCEIEARINRGWARRDGRPAPAPLPCIHGGQVIELDEALAAGCAVCLSFGRSCCKAHRLEVR